MRITTDPASGAIASVEVEVHTNGKKNFLLVDREFLQSRGITDKQFYEQLKSAVEKYFNA
jgi:hypothetical protein